MKSSAHTAFMRGSTSSGCRSQCGTRRLVRRGRFSRSWQYTRQTRLWFPAVALGTQAVVTLPETPALLIDHDRLQGGDHLGIARHAIDARLVVRLSLIH